MVEQWPLKPLVEGSSPSGCTGEKTIILCIKPYHLIGIFLCIIIFDTLTLLYNENMYYYYIIIINILP